MYDRELVRDILSQILSAAVTVRERFAPVKNADFFRLQKGTKVKDLATKYTDWHRGQKSVREIGISGYQVAGHQGARGSGN